MTIAKAIELCDAQKPNGYTDNDKIHWLSKLDEMIFREIIETHEGGAESFTGYGDGVDMDTELLAEEAYADMYVKWLFAQIDFANAETARYANSMAMYNALYASYAGWYNRTHLPKQPNYIRGVR